MGLYINTYGIKLDEINFLINSKDSGKYDGIWAQKPHFPIGLLFESGRTIEEVVHDIIFGDFERMKTGSLDYNWGIYVMCSIHQKSLPNDFNVKYGSQTDMINKYLKEDFNISDFDIEVFNELLWKIFERIEKCRKLVR